MSFVWPENDLNDEQVDAITFPGSVFLTACPGSGKTRALTYKAALELSKLDSDKQRIVAFTYTNRAAEEIHERIEVLGVDTEQLWIGTIHSFCLEWILRPYGIYHRRLQNGFHVIDARETELRLTDICSALANRVQPRHCAYNYTPRGCELRGINADFRPRVMAVLNTYWADLDAKRQIDFEMILQVAYELISTIPSISLLLSQIFKFILVDEYQDTKEIQYGIIAHIMRASAGRTQAFVVGDANQAIFGSLGGFAVPHEEFATECQTRFTPKSLSINYRSSARIVEYFSNYHVVPADIRAEGKSRDFASLITYDLRTSNQDLEGELVRLLRHSIETANIPAREICIIAPQWMPLASITRKLVAALPEYNFDGPGIAPFARNIDNFFYKLSRLALTEPSPQLYVRRLRWAGEIIAEMRHAGAPVRDLSKRALLRLCNEVEVAETDGLTFLALFFDEIFFKLGLELEHYPYLQNHRETFFSDSQDRVAKLESQGIQGISEISMFRRVFASRSGITISSIHNVKGAEFDTVISFGLLQGMVPHFADDSVDSAKKLLYVICSRARKHLHLISETGRLRRRDESYEPTQILADCVFAYDSIDA